MKTIPLYDNLIQQSKSDRGKYIQLISDEIIKNRLIIFVGAGCSISFGIPSWTDLLQQIIKKYKKKTNETDNLKLADRLERELIPLKFREEIAESMKKADITKKSLLHESLIEMDANLFVTTNYDSILEDYLKKKGISVSIIFNEMDIPSIDPTRKTVVKIHGDCNSPSSLVLTSKDYREFKNKKKAFIDWLNAMASQKSILFIGTSFDDPRLLEADEYIINLFGEHRRPPFLLLKIPEKKPNMHDDEYEADLEDFKAKYQDFQDKHFNIVLIETYDQIADILKEINSRVSELKLKNKKNDNDSLLKLKEFQINELIDGQRKILNIQIKTLTDKIIENGQILNNDTVKKSLQKLKEIINDPNYHLSDSDRLEGLFIITDAILTLSDGLQGVLEAKEYFKRISTNKNVNTPDWAERFCRLHAKLLISEGNIDEAIEVVANSKTPKTQAFWLNLLISSEKVNEAVNFINQNEHKIEWIGDVIFVWVQKDKINEAEELFKKVLVEFNKQANKNNLANTPYKNIFFKWNLYYKLINSLYLKGLRLTGKKNLNKVFFHDLTDKSKEFFRNSLSYIENFFNDFSSTNIITDIVQNYLFYQVKLIEMQIRAFLGQKQETDNVVKQLAEASVSPIDQRIIIYLSSDLDAFPKELIGKVSHQLAKDFPDTDWAILYNVRFKKYLGKSDQIWSLIDHFFEVTFSEEEKFKKILLLLQLAGEIKKFEEVFQRILLIPELSDSEKQFWKGFYYWHKEQEKESIEMFNNLNETEIPIEMRAWIRIIKAHYKIANENLIEAEKLLKESINIYIEPYALKSLLEVLTKQQKVGEILNIAEELEVMGIRDKQTLYIKAQAARNLSQFDVAIKTYRELNKTYPDDAGFAFELSRIYYDQNNSDEALNVLKPFYENRELLNQKCLLAACEIIETTKGSKSAFELLNKYISYFQSDYQVLMRHYELANRSNNDKVGDSSFKRISELQQQGLIPEKILKKISIEDIKDFAFKRHRFISELNEHYRRGKLPRIWLCEQNKISVYLDWATRTQDVKLEKLDVPKWIDFTIYFSNYFYFNPQQKILQCFNFPENAKEIVIDYDSLITLHRLGLLEKLGKRFKSVYFPAILKNIWKVESKQYVHHQPSQIELFKRLNEKIIKGDLIVVKPMIDTDPQNSFSGSMLLADEKKIPCLDNFIEKPDLKNFPHLTIIRLLQLLEWLYEHARIDENKWQELQKYLKGQPIVSKTNWKEQLSAKMQVVIDNLTLALLEQYELIKILRDFGVQLYIDTNTERKIKLSLLNQEFVQKVADWHRDLMDKIGGISVFKEIPINLEGFLQEKHQSPYLISLFSLIKKAESTGIPFLTDDRWTQTLQTQNANHLQFGSDVLLTDLYEQGFIKIDEYANAVFTLMEWRYRFFIPAVQVLKHFVDFHKNHLPGAKLEKIANYFRQGMKDPGLFLGIEPTEPPVSTGYRYFCSVWDLWLKLLVQIYSDDNFNQDQCQKLADWFFKQAAPDLPEGISGNFRKVLYKNFSRSIPETLLINIIHLPNHIRLHDLLKRSFDYLLEDREEHEIILESFIDFLLKKEIKHDRSSKEEIEQTKKHMVIKTLETFYGGNIQAIQNHISLKIKSKCPFEFGNYVVNTEIKNMLLQALENYINREKALPIYKTSPLTLFPKEEENKKKPIELTFLHDLIMVPDLTVKEKTLAIIKEAKFISAYSKDKIIKLAKEIKDPSSIKSMQLSQEISQILLKDFGYVHSIWNELTIKPELLESVVPKIIKGTLQPDLNTVNENQPLLLQENQDQEKSLKIITEKLNELPDIIKIGSNELFELNGKKVSFLDWYLYNYYFIPVAGKLSPGSIMEIIINKNKLIPGQLIDFKKYYYEIRDWLEKSEKRPDPLAYIMALEMILVLRSHVDDMTEEQKELFNEDGFKDFVNGVFGLLLKAKTKDDQNAAIFVNMINKKWELRMDLNAHILKHLDVIKQNYSSDEKKCLNAWWLAKVICDNVWPSIIGINILNVFIKNEKEKKAKQIDKLIEKKDLIIQSFNEMINDTDLKHKFIFHEPKMSSVRYYSLFSNLNLSLLAVRILEPKNNAFQGIIKPIEIFNHVFIDNFLSDLMNVHYFNQIYLFYNNLTLNYLWQISPWAAFPAFLKKYYGNAFKYLGKEKVQIIEYFEGLNDPDLLKKQFGYFSKILEESEMDFYVYLNLVYSSLLFNGSVPDYVLKELKNEKQLLLKLLKFKSPLDKECIVIFIKLFQRSIKIGYMDGIDVFRSIFTQIDIGQLNENIIEFIIPALVNSVLFSNDLELLRFYTNKCNKNTALKRELFHVKKDLELVFNIIPLDYRENAKNILNELNCLQE